MRKVDTTNTSPTMIFRSLPPSKPAISLSKKGIFEMILKATIKPSPSRKINWLLDFMIF